MPTLQAIRQRMLQLEPVLLGRIITPSSITATTVVSSELATGTVSSGKFGGKWLLRPGAATMPGDRVRLVTETGFAASTGTLTHAGANYTDTTVGTEVVEVHEFEPYLLDLMINQAVQQCRRIDTQHFQMRPDGRYPLAGYSWLDEPTIITRLGSRGSPTLTDNRHMERWGTVHTDGTLRPDSWTLSGAAATFARSTTAARGRYSLSVQRAGTDAVVSQTIPVRYSSVEDDDLRGQEVVGVAIARSVNASSVRVRVISETALGTALTTTNGSYHTGAEGWEELSATQTVHADADQVTVTARVEVNEVALIDELALVFPGITDPFRRDDALTEWYERPYQYQQNPLTWLGPRGKGQQVIMESQRPYPAFDATRLAAGNADSDVTDCPLDLATWKALSLFFDARKTENAKMMELSKEYASKADGLQTQHLYVPVDRQPGVQLFSGRAYGERGSALSGGRGYGSRRGAW